MSAPNKIRRRLPDETVGDHVFDNAEEEKSKTRISSKKMCSSRWTTIISILIVLLILIIFIAIPIIFFHSASIRRMALFMNFASFQYFYNLTDPSSFGLQCAKPLRIESDDDIMLGAWHIFPKQYQEQKNCSELNEDDFNEDKLVFLYSHGNSGTRASRHRVGLLKLLSNQLDAHIVAYDYRGFGDSTNVPPSASGLANDTRHVYEWLLNRNVSTKRIIPWGHSLGTAVTARFLSECPIDRYPIGAILEAPFTSVFEATKSFPLTIFYRFLPYFKYAFLDPISQNEDTNFNTTALLSSIKCPLLILHARDDGILPFEIGEKLYQQAKDQQPKNVSTLTKFVAFESELGYGHKQIFRDPNLVKIVKNFIDSLEQ